MTTCFLLYICNIRGSVKSWCSCMCMLRFPTVCAQYPRLSDMAPHVTCPPLAATAMTTRPHYCLVQFTPIISANRRLLNHFQPCGHTHTANMRCKAIEAPVVARQPRRCTFSLDITYLGWGMILSSLCRNWGQVVHPGKGKLSIKVLGHNASFLAASLRMEHRKHKLPFPVSTGMINQWPSH